MNMHTMEMILALIPLALAIWFFGTAWFEHRQAKMQCEADMEAQARLPAEQRLIDD